MHVIPKFGGLSYNPPKVIDSYSTPHFCFSMWTVKCQYICNPIRELHKMHQITKFAGPCYNASKVIGCNSVFHRYGEFLPQITVKVKVKYHQMQYHLGTPEEEEEEEEEENWLIVHH